VLADRTGIAAVLILSGVLRFTGTVIMSAPALRERIAARATA
jgi:hypothetical protein